MQGAAVVTIESSSVKTSSPRSMITTIGVGERGSTKDLVLRKLMDMMSP